MQINLTPKTIHFRKPARTSRGAYTEHDMLIVSIHDEQGQRMGIGECAPLPDLSSDRHAYHDLSKVASLINEALASDDHTQVLRHYPALLFALESAMYDYQQTPLLYDTPFARGEEGIPINGLVWMSDYDDMLSQVKKKILAGFRCIKLKIGSITWDEEIRLIEKIRSRYSPDTLQLRVDANGAFTPQEAPDKLRQLAQYGIHSIEQPIKAGQWQAMAALCSSVLSSSAAESLPIALDEELIGINTLEAKQHILDTIRPQYIVIKPTLHGGISGAMEWISEANKRGIGSWITSALESNIGLRSIALLAARVYGPKVSFPQGLGTGQLFTDNIPLDIHINGNKLWRKP